MKFILPMLSETNFSPELLFISWSILFTVLFVVCANIARSRNRLGANKSLAGNSINEFVLANPLESVFYDSNLAVDPKPSSQIAPHHQFRKSWSCCPLLIINEQVSSIRALDEYDSPINIHFSNLIDADFGPMIGVCSVWFGKAIHSLLCNALKHNQRKPDIKIAIYTYLEKDFYTITITDDGIGIQQAKTKKILNTNEGDFYSALEGPQNLQSISFILTQMGGSLEVKSARHFLTKITMRLPVTKGALDQPFECDTRAQDLSTQKNDDPSAPVDVEYKSAQSTDIDHIADTLSLYRLDKTRVKTLTDVEAVKFADKFKAMLADNYQNESFSRPLAARLMIVTEKTLTRRLNTYNAQGFSETLRKFRLAKAMTFLLRGEQVTTVAFKTGFSSPSYFARCFRTEFGVAPSSISKKTDKFQKA